MDGLPGLMYVQYYGSAGLYIMSYGLRRKECTVNSMNSLGDLGYILLKIANLCLGLKIT